MSTVGLIIGHSSNSRGALNLNNGIYEYDFNLILVNIIKHKLIKYSSITPIVIIRDTYANLPNKINNFKCDINISFHANAFNTRVEGCETLYSDGGSYRLAKLFNSYINKVLLNNNRGIKKISKTDRGYHLLNKTKRPTIIIEPFFIDNDKELSKALINISNLSDNIIKAIEDYF